MDDPVFSRAQAIVFRHEGGLIDDPHDPGGLTKYGIALHRHPEMTAEQIRDMTQDQAAEIYYRQYWVPYRWRDLPTVIANKSFDASVVMGAREAIIALQRALRACGTTVVEDGELGDITLGDVSRVMSIQLLSAYRSELAGYFRALAAERPMLKGALPGWLNRAYE